MFTEKQDQLRQLPGAQECLEHRSYMDDYGGKRVFRPSKRESRKDISTSSKLLKIICDATGHVMTAQTTLIAIVLYVSVDIAQHIISQRMGKSHNKTEDKSTRTNSRLTIHLSTENQNKQYGANQQDMILTLYLISFIYFSTDMVGFLHLLDQ